MKIQYRQLHDILAKIIYVKAGSFDSVTRDRFMLMTAITFDVNINWSSLLFGVLREMVTPGSRQAKGYAIQICVLLRNVPGLELGESKTFPIHRVLNQKTVHQYVVNNDKLGGEEVVDAPKVKRTHAKKKGVTKKRPAAGDAEVAPIVKKKRTTKGKPVAAKRLPVEEPVGVSTTSEQPVAEILRLNELKKTVLTQGVTADTASLEIRKAINAVDAKILLLDGQVAAIKSEQLEFQAKIAADLLSLSTQIGDLVDYIRSGDAKKGEGSSRRRPLPTPVHHSEGTGDAVRLMEPTQADIDNANRAILERMRNEDSFRAERERDRARREIRLSRSGAYKRRRGY
ncbi:hypothetical protein F511_44510 [Dorcoceras hygrometricum]|uniref:Uncharacterized protein n=1 Tax=Dorcoceras hygrometricum TaxID=472368 RepID=A0A2Z7BEI0_9LAMI|nr:hypothetical protein F511_44510 [Dorcoceras hygrometricum]